MPNPGNVLKRVIRSVRGPNEGSPRFAGSTNQATTGNASVDAVVDADGNVRRLWVPGDPWSSEYYFGGDRSS